MVSKCCVHEGEDDYVGKWKCRNALELRHEASSQHEIQLPSRSPAIVRELDLLNHHKLETATLQQMLQCNLLLSTFQLISANAMLKTQSHRRQNCSREMLVKLLDIDNRQAATFIAMK